MTYKFKTKHNFMLLSLSFIKFKSSPLNHLLRQPIASKPSAAFSPAAVESFAADHRRREVGELYCLALQLSSLSSRLRVPRPPTGDLLSLFDDSYSPCSVHSRRTRPAGRALSACVPCKQAAAKLSIEQPLIAGLRVCEPSSPPIPATVETLPDAVECLCFASNSPVSEQQPPEALIEQSSVSFPNSSSPDSGLFQRKAALSGPGREEKRVDPLPRAPNSLFFNVRQQPKSLNSGSRAAFEDVWMSGLQRTGPDPKTTSIVVFFSTKIYPNQSPVAGTKYYRRALKKLMNPVAVLYDAWWTKDVDNLFIDLLAEAHVGGEWTQGRPGTHVFLYCRGVLVADDGATFTVNELQERFDFLHKWFRVFSWMLRKHGLHHCIQSNVLTAPVAVWNDIFECITFFYAVSDPFSVAYQHSRDPHWADIRYLFTEVYEATSNSPNVVDQNSTNENHLARLTEQSYVFSLSSLTNAPLHGSIGNEGIQPRNGRDHDASSEGSVNTHT
ncbi:lipid-transfer protein [Striga asiatica]|uniref:Lipid-transfer protein n=1 Tax=Striga asiatica TaxID=4170 RepID=A0A5A7PLM7_STRAF|nr:lipid-transfer protein [Striga asiatica]